MIEKELIINNSKYKTAHEIKNLCILSLIDSYSRVKNMQNIISFNENKIRDKFVSDMNNNCKLIRSELNNNTIRIIPESWDPDKKRRADIVFFIAGIGDFTFECKKLASAEKRYLGEGIFRFIDLQYAEKEKEGGMIGFVTSKNLARTVSGLKDKIKTFHIHKLLDKAVVGHVHSFQSIHIRKNSSYILISHLFFHFSKN